MERFVWILKKFWVSFFFFFSLLIVTWTARLDRWRILSFTRLVFLREQSSTFDINGFIIINSLLLLIYHYHWLFVLRFSILSKLLDSSNCETCNAVLTIFLIFQILRNEILQPEGGCVPILPELCRTNFFQKTDSATKSCKRNGKNSPLRWVATPLSVEYFSLVETSIGRRLFKADCRFDQAGGKFSSWGSGEARAAPRPEADKSHRIRD